MKNKYCVYLSNIRNFSPFWITIFFVLEITRTDEQFAGGKKSENIRK
jgi:hypothetical protein